jgi:hypothetical protein
MERKRPAETEMEKEERMRWLRTRESKSKEKVTVELAKKGRRMKGGKEGAEEKKVMKTVKTKRIESGVVNLEEREGNTQISRLKYE